MTIETDPFFRREPEELFEPGAAAFAAGIVGDYWDACAIPSDLDISQVKVADWLLAKGFPSRTGPMGSALNNKWPLATANFDMSTEFMTDQGRWYDDTYLGRYTWHHSDWKNAPYVYVYSLFEKIVKKEN